MNYDNLDEESRERHKKEQVEYRTKKRNSFRFQLFASLFEIIETVVIMIALIVLAAFIAFGIFHIGDNPDGIGLKVFQGVLVLIFLVGMVLGFIIYKKVVRWYIIKFKKKDKLNQDLLIHYFREEELKKL